MNKLKVFGIFLLFLIISVFTFLPNITLADVWVNGYTKSNGTYVQGHYRSSPDGNPYNNYSYPGNTNPYTGKTATGNTSTYLDNYYSNSGTSSLYNSYSLPTYTSPSLYTIPTYTPPTSYGSLYSTTTQKTIEGGYYIGSSLFCNSDYYKLNESCVKAPANSIALYTSFLCKTGYYQVGSICEKVPENGYALGNSFSCYSGYIKQNNQCNKPLNAEIIGTTLYCNTGYAINSTGDGCISKNDLCKNSYGLNTYEKDNSCYCNTGYEWNTGQTSCVPLVTCGINETKVNGQCVSLEQSCKISFGEGAFAANSLCYCNVGYSWSSDLKTCEIGSKKITAKQLKLGTNNADTILLHNFLAQQKLYTGQVNSPINKETKKAITAFQKNNRIQANGVAGPKTIQKINELIK